MAVDARLGALQVDLEMALNGKHMILDVDLAMLVRFGTLRVELGELRIAASVDAVELINVKRRVEFLLLLLLLLLVAKFVEPSDNRCAQAGSGS